MAKTYVVTLTEITFVSFIVPPVYYRL